jgi:sugar/nucleoside kinase (ribokinase family)
MGEPADVVVAGHICLDVIPDLGTTPATPAELFVPGKLTEVGAPVFATGGPVANTGLALHRLGMRTRLMGKVADDQFGRTLLDLLRERDPALAGGMVVAEGETSSYSIILSNPGFDRIIFHCPGCNHTFGADDVPLDALGGARLFHFGYPPLMRRIYERGGAECAALLGAVRERGLTTSLDMSLPDPASEAGRLDWPAFYRNVLPGVDVFTPSIDEILFTADRATYDRLQDAAGGGDLLPHVTGAVLHAVSDRLLAWGAAVVLVKCGSEGAYLRTSSDRGRLAAAGALFGDRAAEWAGRELFAPCFRVEAVGTVGSGDCTIAGFLAGLLEGEGPAGALRAAVGTGACCVEQPDATSGVRPLGELRERIDAGWARRAVGLDLPGWTFDSAGGLWTAGGAL